MGGGGKKRVALVSVLSLRPDVWLLDEPTASLDPRSQSRLLDFIGELGREGKTIITATHDLDGNCGGDCRLRGDVLRGRLDS
jgi:cobalt/nickel transport system ATP-binding protein